MLKMLVSVWNSLKRLAQRSAVVAIVVVPVLLINYAVGSYIPILAPWNFIFLHLSTMTLFMLLPWHIISEWVYGSASRESLRFFIFFGLFTSQLVGLMLFNTTSMISFRWDFVLYWIVYTALHASTWILIGRIYIGQKRQNKPL